MNRLLLLALAGPFFASAAVLHVAPDGDDAADGISPESAFATLQRAAEVAEPGDEIELAPGLYQGATTLDGVRGTAARPITIRADRIAPGRVVFSGAAPSFRSGDVAWRLDDAELCVYSAAFEGPTPTRFLYSGVDLFPYETLAHLRAFTRPVEPPLGQAGPKHGFFHDRAAGRIYVRLHASGRYGSPDPHQHVMALSPHDGFLITITEPGDAHLIFTGITFETPGMAAIQAHASHVTVRDCWFRGTPFAVAGNAEDPGSVTDVVIAHCDYGEAAIFADAEELLADLGAEAGERRNIGVIWSRKSPGHHGLPADRISYETGIAAWIGTRWTIRHNYIHDVFEGIDNQGMSWARDVRIHDNRFERIIDNAIETEFHANHVHIYRNEFTDTYEPISYQPNAGPPWPASIFVFQNVFTTTADYEERWRVTPHFGGATGMFKVGISLKNWQRGHVPPDYPKSPLAVPGLGLRVFNNTIDTPKNRWFTLLGDYAVPLGGTVFANNLVDARFLHSTGSEARELRPGHFRFLNNVVRFKDSPAASAEMAAGEGGRVLGTGETMGWVDPERGDYRLEASGVARSQLVVALPDAPTTFRQVGAIQPGDSWYPVQAGPRVDERP